MFKLACLLALVNFLYAQQPQEPPRERKKMEPLKERKEQMKDWIKRGGPEMSGKMFQLHRSFEPFDTIKRLPELIIHQREKLEITDEQMQKIKESFATSQKNIIRKRADIEIVNTELKLQDLSKIDFPKIKSLLKQKHDLESELTILEVEEAEAIYKLLTQEQQKKIEEMRKYPFGKRHHPEPKRERKLEQKPERKTEKR